MKKRKVILLLLLYFVAIGPGHLIAQRVSKVFSNTPLKSVLKEIEKQAGYSIMYKTDEVNETKLVTATFNDTPIEDVLKSVLDSNLSYTIENKMIIIHAGSGKSQVATQQINKVKDISGVVVDANNEPVIGATVVLKGTTIGAVTDINGAFSLNKIPEDSQIEISFIGMQSQLISVVGRTFFNITLVEDSKQLEQVVVTAMGIERKAKSLTYATQKMGNEDLMRVQDANFINSLQGKSAGLSITPNAGGAGGSSKILLRGNKSILGNNTPLIVVDGVPMTNSVKGQQGVTGGESIGYNFVSEGTDALSSINPDDIESINILKGANAAALYGSAASNGVLMITTKRGKEGKMSVNVTSNATFERPLVLPELQDIYGANINSLGKVQIGSWGQKMSEMSGDILLNEGLTNHPQDYISDFFRTGSTFNNSISLSGGTKNMLSYFSFGNSTANGMLDNNNFNRNTASFRQNYNFWDSRVKVDLAFNYLNQKTKNRPGGGESLNPLYHLYVSPRNVNMKYFKKNYENPNGTWKSGPYGYYHLTANGYSWREEQIELKGLKQNWIYDAKNENNPYWLINRTKLVDEQERVYGYLAGSVDIVDGLKASGRFSIDRSKSTSTSQRWATTQTPSGIMPWGEYWNSTSSSNEFYLDWMLSYDKEFGDYSVSVNGGYTAHHIRGRSQNIGTVPATIEDPRLQKLPTAINIFDISAGLTGNRNLYKSVNWDEGLFVTGQFGYKNFLFLEGSYRQDWYRVFKQFSARGFSDNYGYYSFGANGLIHEMVELPAFWNYMKVRTSYSEVGNSIPNLIYDATKIDPLTGAATPSQFAFFENPIPEKTKSFEAGFDASFFRNSLTWDVTYYRATMNNNYLLLGVAGKQKPVNTGVIRNSGVESSLGYSMNISHNLLWKTGFNFSYNDNKILETYKENGKEMLIDQKIGFGGKVQVRYSEGGSYGDIYVTDFKRDDNGKIVLNSSGSPSLSSEKFGKFMGNMNAPYLLGWNNTFTYKGVSLYMLIDGRIGGKVISFTEAYLDRFGVSKRTGDARQAYEAGNLDYKINSELTLRDLVENPNLTKSPEEAIRNYYEAIGGDINASQYIYKGTNFRLREVSLGYTFKNLLGQSKDLSFSLIGRNLFFIYKDAPVDPETSISTQNSLGNIDVFNMPTSRSLGASLSVNF
jgi:TonB-linked SusC/RagA family outer membrane protein